MTYQCFTNYDIMELRLLDSEQLNTIIVKLRKERRDLRLLIESDGWKIVLEQFRLNATNLKADTSSSWFQSFEHVFKDQFDKGTAHGLNLVSPAAEGLLKNMDMQLAVLSAVMKEKSSGTDTDSDPDTGRRDLTRDPDAPDPELPLGELNGAEQFAP